MTLNDLSSEQQEFVHLALSGKNVLCEKALYRIRHRLSTAGLTTDMRKSPPLSLPATVLPSSSKEAAIL